MSDKTADGTVETPTVEELTAQLESEKLARSKAEGKIVEMKKSSTKSTDSLSEEELKTKELLKGMGFTTQEELDDFKKFKSDIISKEEKATEEKEFNDFTWNFNTLTGSQKEILKDLKKVHKDKTYDEILKSTNFINDAQLEKAKQGKVVGWDTIGLPAKKEKVTVSDKSRKRLNLKSSEDVSNIKSKFGL